MTSSGLVDELAVRPRLEHVPASVRSSADEVFEFLDIIDLPLLPWQRYSLGATLGERADGRWSAPTVVELCPRQNGKSYKWAARVLAGLFVLGEELITFTAHKVQTALEVFRLVEYYAMRNASTRRMIAHVVHTQGRESIELTTGQRFIVVSRIRSSGRGFSGDLLILDEALELRDQAAINALLPTLAARKNPQLVFTSSAGDPGSVVLANLRQQGMRAPDDMAFFEYSAEADADLDDERVWKQANPSLGTLIQYDTLRRHRKLMSVDGFRVEHLGIWANQTADAVISDGVWSSTRIELEGEPVPGQLGLAFDVMPDRRWGSVVVAFDIRGRTHIRLARHRLGDGWLVDDLAALAAQYGVPIAYDTSGAGRDIADQLRVRGVPLLAINGRDYASSCARLLSGLANTTITHHPDLALDDAAANASSRAYGESWAFARKNAGYGSAPPVTPITAAALAVYANDHAQDSLPAPRPEVF